METAKKLLLRSGLPGLLVSTAIMTVAVVAPAQAIIGGVVVRGSDAERSFTVRVEAGSGQMCSGVVIGPRLVLTAAHCVLGSGRARVVALGPDMRPRSHRVARVAAHESFEPGLTPRTQPGVDLAILGLASDLMGSMVPLPAGRGLSVGDSLSIAGFGLSGERRRVGARTLRRGDLITAGAYTSANRVAVAVDGRKRGLERGVGACKGDSGGPIVRGTGARRELVGVVSWSSGPATARPGEVCGGFTAITPVADHLTWIDQTSGAVLASLAADAQASGKARRTPRGTAQPPSQALDFPAPDRHDHRDNAR